MVFLVWLDTRTASEVDEILGNPTTKAQAERIRRLCGLPMSTYFSALKVTHTYLPYACK